LKLVASFKNVPSAKKADKCTANWDFESLTNTDQLVATSGFKFCVISNFFNRVSDKQ
jgi:hypothetical protein